MASGCRQLCADSVYNVVPAPISRVQRLLVVSQNDSAPRPPRAALLNHFTGAKILGYICVCKTLKLIQQIRDQRFVPICKRDGVRDVWGRGTIRGDENEDSRFLSEFKKWPEIICNLRHCNLQLVFDREGLIGSTLFVKIMQNCDSLITLRTRCLHWSITSLMKRHSVNRINREGGSDEPC